MTSILNPAKGASDDSRIWANLDPEIHTYFFRKVFADDRGIKQALVNIFFAKLHAACLAADIPAEWDPSNETTIADILNKLNFNEPIAITVTKPASRRARTRRTVDSSSVSA